MNGRQAESCECVSATEIAKKEMKRNGNENVDVNVNVNVEVKGQKMKMWKPARASGRGS